MPEVAGGAAILVSPGDEISLAEEIDKAMEDKNLSQKLIKSGYSRASEFSWKKTAQSTISIFQEVSLNR